MLQKIYLACISVKRHEKRECLLIGKVETLIIQVLNNSYPVGVRSLHKFKSIKQRIETFIFKENSQKSKSRTHELLDCFYEDIKIPGAQ